MFVLFLHESSTDDEPAPIFLANPSPVLFTDYSAGQVYEVCFCASFRAVRTRQGPERNVKKDEMMHSNISCPDSDYTGAEKHDFFKPMCQSHPSYYSILLYWSGWAFSFIIVLKSKHPYAQWCVEII